MRAAVHFHWGAGRGVATGHGAKAGDLRQPAFEPFQICVQPACGHPGRVLLLHPPRIHVDQEPHLAKECPWILVERFLTRDRCKGAYAHDMHPSGIGNNVIGQMGEFKQCRLEFLNAHKTEAFGQEDASRLVAARNLPPIYDMAPLYNIYVIHSTV